MYKNCVQPVYITRYNLVQKAVDVLPAFTQYIIDYGAWVAFMNSLVHYVLRQATYVCAAFTQHVCGQQQSVAACFAHYTQALLLPLLRYNKEYNIERSMA
jgi:hypothetical protein